MVKVSDGQAGNNEGVATITQNIAVRALSTSENYIRDTGLGNALILNGQATTIINDGDGMLLSGNFNGYNNGTTPATLLKINSLGQLDTVFSSHSGTGFNSSSLPSIARDGQ